MTMRQLVMKLDSIAEMATVHTMKPNAAVVTTGHQPLPRWAPRPDDSHSSAAGEEDPGAALDMLGACAVWPGRCCPWPKT